ncbi:hypothetical protein CYMTET_14458, partial [Cymbomonas tetramitiformis]
MFDDSAFDASFTANFKTAMAVSSGVASDDVEVISKYQGSVSINSQVTFSWDDISAASSFQSTLSDSVSTIFISSGGDGDDSADFWSQCGSPETLSSGVTMIAASPPPPSPPLPPPPPAPPPFGIIHVESTIEFLPLESDALTDPAQVNSFLDQYILSVAEAAGVDPAYVNITLVTPIFPAPSYPAP